MSNINLIIIWVLVLLAILLYLLVFGRRSKKISINGLLLLILGIFLQFAGNFPATWSDFLMNAASLKVFFLGDIPGIFVRGLISPLLVAGGLIRCTTTPTGVEVLRGEAEKKEITEEKFNKERSQLSGLLKSIPDSVFFKDTEGTYLGCNPAFSHLMKMSEGEIIGKKSPDLYSREVADLIKTQEKELFDKEEVITHERWLHYPDGKSVFLQTVKAPLYDESGNISGLVGVSRDITEKKKAEDAIIKARLAEDANRAKSEFLATMSHELRTPLNSVIGFSDLLLEGLVGELNERQIRYVRNISNSGKHLLHLINDILDLSKIEAGKTTLETDLFEVSNVFGEMESMFGSLVAVKKLTLKFETGEKPVTINGDRMRFKQILFNLISNAIKFTPEGGCVTVLAAKDGDSLRVSVADSGIGISEEDLDNLFQPFRQLDSFLKRRYEGAGLGLFLVKKFVEMHGGKVWAESEPGKGSVFTFELPVDGAVSPQDGSASQVPVNLS